MNRPLISKLNAQRGSPMVVMLTITAIIFAVTAALAVGSSDFSMTSAAKSDVLAASLMNQGGVLLQTASVLVTEGTSPSVLTVDTTATGLFGPSGVSLPNQPASLYATTAPLVNRGWQTTIDRTIAITGKGTAATDELFLHTGIDTNVCKVVNRKLNGLASIPTQASLTTTYSWSSGCYTRTSDGLNVFFVLWRAL